MHFDTEFDFYLENQEELLKTYNNKVLAIIGKEVVGVFDDYRQADNECSARYKGGTFMLQLCTPGDSAYTTHSLSMFPIR